MFRRDFLLGFGFWSLGSITSRTYGETAGTVFNIKWRDLNIGFSRCNLTRQGSKLAANIEVSINVKLLGINLFNYQLQAKEIWENKTLQHLDCVTTIGDKEEFARGFRVKNGFKINGSSYSGTIDGNPATTSYYTPEFLKRNIWISTQNGTPLKVNVEDKGFKNMNTSSGLIKAKEWKVNGDLELNLFYDSNNEWVGSNFVAGGSVATFILHNKAGNLNSVWSQT